MGLGRWARAVAGSRRHIVSNILILPSVELVCFKEALEAL